MANDLLDFKHHTNDSEQLAVSFRELASSFRELPEADEFWDHSAIYQRGFVGQVVGIKCRSEAIIVLGGVFDGGLPLSHRNVELGAIGACAEPGRCLLPFARSWTDLANNLHLQCSKQLHGFHGGLNIRPPPLRWGN